MNGSSSTSRLQSRKEASRKSLSTSTVGIVVASGVVVVSLLSLLVGILVAFASRKQNKELITATSNLLGVSKQDLVDFASVPLEAMHQYNSNNYNVSSFSGNGNKVLSLVERPTVPNVIGYAISLVKCEDKQSFAAGLIDAALVLRHSVHRTSVRQVGSKSVYDYKMIAFVHTAAQGCADPLKDAGFTIIVKDSPVQKKEIQGEFLLKNIGSEWCCGEKEFIKLYAYTIDDLPIVIHVDMDFVFYQPMDDLFDAMLYSRDSEIGKRARDRIPTEFLKTMHWPERIDAFMTRDWPQVIPGRKSGFQAGFLVIQPNRDVFDILVDVLRKGDYVDGYSRENGWGGLGYGGFVGAKAMQGLLAYVYDVLLNDTWVELNQCRFNHFGMDVRFRAASGFRANHPKVRLFCDFISWPKNVVTRTRQKLIV